MADYAVDEMTVDKAFHSALKLHVYNTVHGTLLENLLRGESVVMDEAVQLSVGRFTARKTNHLFVPKDGSRSRCSAEFYGFTSHKVREKLSDLEEEGVLDLMGKGLRDAFQYRWSKPLKHWEICSFMRFKRYAEDDLTLHFELGRAFHEFATSTFTFPEFFDVYKAVHEAEYATTRWGKRKWKKLKDKHDYLRFVKDRLEALVDHELVQKSGKKYAVRPRAKDAVHHFDLFVNGTAFHPSRSMCDACPMDELCQAGSTQKLVRAFNDLRQEPQNSA